MNFDKHLFNGTHNGKSYHAEVMFDGADGYWKAYNVDVVIFDNATGEIEESFSRYVVDGLSMTPKKAVRRAFNIARGEGCL